MSPFSGSAVRANPKVGDGGTWVGNWLTDFQKIHLGCGTHHGSFPMPQSHLPETGKMVYSYELKEESEHAALNGNGRGFLIEKRHGGLSHTKCRVKSVIGTNSLTTPAIL